MSHEFIWWKHGVFYQIYPRSFMDSDGDGVGDLQGIIDRLDYLTGLGVDAVWISPIFASPMVDYGYDVSDHTAIHPSFGDMETFDRLLSAAHERNIRIVLDFVPNHTSRQHPWFVESRKGQHNRKRDWYIWKEAQPDGSPPNNWEAFTGESAWEWDEETEQYYLHLFFKEQPDLNWRNPEVVEAMHDVLRFWLDRGVDGFRMDAVVCCAKDSGLTDNPPIGDNSPFRSAGLKQEPVYTMNQPGIHDILRRFRGLLDSYGDERVMIGETFVFEPTELAKYYGKNLDEFQIPFNFITMMTSWRAGEMKQSITAYYDALPQGATPNFVFGNHDEHRLATRFGPDNLRSAAMLLLTLWGIPMMYYADELGMENVDIPPERRLDPLGKQKPNLDLGRDPERTPMQWDASPNAGFSSPRASPWLPVAENYKEVNVSRQQRDPSSTLNFYKSLLRLRREMPALHRGDFTLFEEMPGEIMAYVRSAERKRVLVVVNFGASGRTLDLSSLNDSGELLLSSEFRKPGRVVLSELALNPHESLLILLS
ncbi:MAG: alpha-amylase family glycosyl hydrolase [Candidatus Neomarinimicrobiota bacterium]